MTTTSTKKRILIVDDEPHIITAISFLLTQKGYDIEKAKNGKQALQKAELVRPDIIILDVMMPEMDGFEVARRLRQQDQFDDLHIIFLTARGTQEDRFRGYETGGEVYLTKPFDNDQLLLTVQEVLEFG
mgnify:CR=1 FL=1